MSNYEPKKTSIEPRAAKTVLRALLQPVLLISSDDKIQLANDAAEQFFGVSGTHLLLRKIGDFIPFSSPLHSLIKQVRKRDGAINEYAVDLVRPDQPGQNLVDIQVVPAGDEPGTVLVVLFERSIANKIDQQLSHRGAARSVVGISAMLAHEVKNPLSGIRGAAQLLSDTVGDEDLALTQLICDETDRICKLVDKMEMFSDNRAPERRAVNIHTVLNRVRGIAEAGFAADVRFTEQYDPSIPPVLGNLDQLIQVFLNLVKNASEALKTKNGEREIILKTAYLPGMRLTVPGLKERTNLPIEMTVIDNGPGISDELIQHIFEPFVSGRSGGTGLGLSLVAKIIGDHGGIIECNPSSRGTKFRVLLPMYREYVDKKAEE